MWHESIVPNLIYFSEPEYYLPRGFIVVSPGELPTFIFVYSWLLLIFIVYHFGLSFIVGLFL